MNPFEKINQMKDILKEEAKGVKDTDTITQFEHYKKMLNMLSILTEELKSAEYNYEVENDEKGDYHTFEEMTIQSKQLTDDLLIVQPMVDPTSIEQIDMQSLYKILCDLKENDRIKEDIIILPPYVNILRARLAVPKNPDEDEENETDEE